MPDPITATVNWDSTKNKPQVTPNPIVVPSGNGETTINWVAGTDITSFEIKDLPSSEFTMASNNQSATDQNDTQGTYHYTVTATHSSGVTAEPDPKIENGSGMH